MCNLEDVSKRVAHHCPPVPIRSVARLFKANRAGSQCTPKRSICVTDIDVEKRGKQLALAGCRHHDEGIAEANFGWTVGLHLAGGIEHGAQELNLGFDIVDDHARSHRVEAGHALDLCGLTLTVVAECPDHRHAEPASSGTGNSEACPHVESGGRVGEVDIERQC